jgi:hypothetical protein
MTETLKWVVGDDPSRFQSHKNVEIAAGHLLVSLIIIPEDKDDQGWACHSLEGYPLRAIQSIH